MTQSGKPFSASVLNKGGRIRGERMTEQAIYNVVLYYADKINVGRIAPHDLRRTFAKLAHKGGSGLDQIQLSLGHSSIQTTERYLGTEQDLTDAPCDHLGLRLIGDIKLEQYCPIRWDSSLLYNPQCVSVPFCVIEFVTVCGILS